MSKDRKKKLYLLDYRLKWSAFKKLQDKLIKDSGPTLKQGNRILWKLMKEKSILCWFADNLENDMGIGLEIPKRYKNWEIKIIGNPTKKVGNKIKR